MKVEPKMEPVVWFGNLILLMLFWTVSAVCVDLVARVEVAPAALWAGAFRIGMRNASLRRLPPGYGDPGSRTDSVL